MICPNCGSSVDTEILKGNGFVQELYMCSERLLCGWYGQSLAKEIE